jgi:beta-phosphoglucomutase
MLKGIIFDMDGVLIDSHPVHRHAWHAFLATLGREITDDQLDFILEGRRREEILRHFLGDLPPETIAEYGRRKDRIFEANFDRVQLMPGVEDFLEKLESAGLRIGVATSASSRRTRETLRRLKLNGVFSTVVTGDDVCAGKPDPALYRLAAKRMDCFPADLMALEDAACGVRAARAAGMRCIGVASNGRADELRRAGAEHIIQSFVGLSIPKLRALCDLTTDI